jgi:putative peptide zinc metalloprotease protein
VSEGNWQGPLSPNWHRVAGLRPRLRGHVRTHHHVYRGRDWWVLEDRATGQQHRLDPAGYALVEQLDGHRSLDSAWNRVATLLGDDAPTQDEALALLGQLYGADAIQCETGPDVELLFERGRDRRRKARSQRFKNPLALRLPLMDPDRLLQRMMPLLGGWFSTGGAALWLALVLPALLAAVVHWEQLAADLGGRVLSPDNLLLVSLVFPLMKAVHELAHGLAVKRWGGDVPEAGLMMLVLFPIPYVDASAASAFPSRRRRMLVGAAGMLGECLVAAVAMGIWLLVEPGLVRTLAWNVMLVAGISVVLFNGNPLMRFDGYYILADGLEIPNLATRANGYLRYLLQRFGMGMRDARSPLEGADERGWLLGYGIGAFVYRLFLTFSIALFLAESYPLVGAGLAVFAVSTQIVWPLLKGLAFLVADGRLARRRLRALAGAAAMAGVLAVAALIDIPTATVAPGVLWPSEHGTVRAGTDGFVVSLDTPPGSQVSEGQVLLRLADPIRSADLQVLEAQVEAAQRQHLGLLREDRVEADLAMDTLERLRAELQQARLRSGDLVLRAPAAGEFQIPHSADLQGRFLRQGDLVGHVLTAGPAHARVVVDQDDVGRLREGVLDVQVLPRGASEAMPARILNEIPAGATALPSPALAASLGGQVEVENGDDGTPKATRRLFQFALELPIPGSTSLVGARIHARFAHASEPLWRHLTRATRQLFLARLTM